MIFFLIQGLLLCVNLKFQREVKPPRKELHCYFSPASLNVHFHSKKSLVNKVCYQI